APPLAQAAARYGDRGVKLAEPRQRVRHPGEPAVEAESRTLRRLQGSSGEPFLVFRYAHSRRLGQRVQHTCRAVREAETAAGDTELVDVAGEEPVRTVRGRARADRAHHACRQLIPARAVTRAAGGSVSWLR